MTATTQHHASPSETVRGREIDRVPRVPVRAAAARWVARRAFRRLPISVMSPDGVRASEDASSPLMVLHRPTALYHRVAATGTVGFGESYQAGDWDSPDLAALLTAFTAGLDRVVPRALHALRRHVFPHTSHATRPTLECAPANIAFHYDLSNDLFGIFLDETMTYSAAWFGNDPERDAAALAAAQRRKIDRLLDRCGVGSGTTVLEIGTGWGQLALQAAQRGAVVRTITLSREQQQLARQRIAAAGVGDRVEVLLEDYRRAGGRYDAVISVEMIEAVGEDHWGEYVVALDRLLAPGGTVGLQAITMDDRRVRAVRHRQTWTSKHIFPGGRVPSVRAVESLARRLTTLRLVDRMAFGADYADTLAIWRERFDTAADDVAALGFDDRFRRTWRFYLAISEAGFRSGYLDVEQLVFRR